MLAILTRRATARGAFWGVIAGMAVVLTVAFSPWTRDIAFLWHNVIGAVVVFVVGMIISALDRSPAYGGSDRQPLASRL
jgi:Na+/proline symporter